MSHCQANSMPIATSSDEENSYVISSGQLGLRWRFKPRRPTARLNTTEQNTMQSDSRVGCNRKHHGRVFDFD